MQKQNFRTSHFLWVITSLIIVLVPFHAVFTAWFASTFGYFDAVRLWKEVLLVVISAFVVNEVVRDKNLRRELSNNWLIRFSLLFLGFATLMTGVGLLAQNVSLEAAAYGAVINMRFIVFMLCIFILVKRLGMPRNWFRLIMVPAIIVIIFGLLQLLILPHNFLHHFGYGPKTLPAYQAVDSRPALARLQSTLRGPNPLGAYLVPIIILLLAYARRLNKNKIAMAALIVASLLVLYGTYSRSAILGLMVAGWCYVFLSLKSKNQKKLQVIISSGIVIIIGAFIFGLRDNDAVQNVAFHSNEHSGSPHSSNEKRASSLQNGLKDIYREPFGRGVGSAGPASLRNKRAGGRIAESYFLQIGQETGVFGLLLFLGFLVTLGRALWRKRSEALPRVVLASLIGLCLVNLVSHAWADDTLAYIFFGMAGLALASKETVQKAKKRATL